MARLTDAQLQALIDGFNFSNANKEITGDVLRQYLQSWKDSFAEGLILDGRSIEEAIAALEEAIADLENTDPGTGITFSQQFKFLQDILYWDPSYVAAQYSGEPDVEGYDQVTFNIDTGLGGGVVAMDFYGMEFDPLSNVNVTIYFEARRSVSISPELGNRLVIGSSGMSAELTSEWQPISLTFNITGLAATVEVVLDNVQDVSVLQGNVFDIKNMVITRNDTSANVPFNVLSVSPGSLTLVSIPEQPGAPSTLTGTRVQHLILTGEGVKPTVPSSEDLRPGDVGWLATDIMQAEKCWNETDNIWYSRKGDTIYPESGTPGPTVLQETGQSTTAVMSQKAVTDELDKNQIGDAHGFISPPNTGNFTIANTGDVITVNLLANAGNYKLNGKDYENTGLSVTFTASLGQNFLCVNASGLVVSPFDLLDLTKIPCCIIDWDGTNAVLGDELHLANRNLIQHLKEHQTDGARWVSGFVTTFGAAAANTFSSATGEMRDEERYHTIAAKTQGSIMYRNAALTAMISDTPSTAYAKLSGALPVYDNNGVLTALGNNNFGTIWQYSTNRKLPANSEIVFVTGQGVYDKADDARAAKQPTLAGMSVAEWKLLYHIVIKQTGGVLEYIDNEDLRLTTTGLAVSGDGLTTLPASSVTTTPTATLLSTNAAATHAELDAKILSRTWTEDLTAWVGTETALTLVSNVFRDLGATEVTTAVTVTLTAVTSPRLAEYYFKFKYGTGGSFIYTGVTASPDNPELTVGTTYEAGIVRGVLFYKIATDA